ncbi:MAG: glycosyltransferase [Sphingobacteriales bacterium]|nr:MAG: glycosyltransferase [Sphingobacteriales bacterium]
MKQILFICPYDSIYPPVNGGMQRCLNILHQLAKHFKVTAIIHQDKTEFKKSIDLFPALASVNIYSTKDEEEPRDLFSVFPARIKRAIRYRLYKRVVKGETDSSFLLYYSLLNRLLKQQVFDSIMLENLATINAVDVIRRHAKKVSIIYDAHNVDSRLAMESISLGSSKTEAVGMQYVESTLHKKVNAIIACSEKDKGNFLLLNANKLPVFVIPNGVTIPGHSVPEGIMKDVPSHIIFCGSMGYAPNEEAILWFYNEIWPVVKAKFPELIFLIVGSGVVPVSLHKLRSDKAVVFSGKVNDLEPWYSMAALAIVPIKTGSGTRLKILEAMGYGIPVVSTSKGAEGINYTAGRSILIADNAEQFADEVILLLNNKEKRLSLKATALDLVTKSYNWDLIGIQLQHCINNLS